jgi:cytosine/adenosine deaminase-related metal-dependent hydrolase
MNKTTLLRARWIVTHDGREHRLLSGGELAWRGSEIVYVGAHCPIPADDVIDAGDALVVPGFISTHAHVGSHAGDRLVFDAGRRDFLRSGFLNYAPQRSTDGPGFLDAEDGEAAIRYGLSCLLCSGVTTVVEMGGGNAEDMVRLAGKTGLRLYYGPVFNGGRYVFEANGRLHRLWDEETGFAELAAAERFIRRHHDTHDGRVRGMLVLDEVFNATPSLLHRAKEAARRLNVGLTVHCAEQLWEFHDILRRTGHTPVGWLAAEGFLGPEVILAHCVYVDAHSLTAYPFAGDLPELARSRATVAHAPVALARRGVMLESFERYRAAGINLALGTDTYPLDIIGEMRWAAILGKVTDRNNESASARAVFDAATLGGAKALGRDDLGRLAPGARADLVVVDFARMRIGPVRDPIRALVYCATGDLVDRVVVDGRTVVENGQVLAWGEQETLDAVRRSTERVWESFSAYHWSGQRVDQVFPPSLPTWHGSSSPR